MGARDLVEIQDGQLLTYFRAPGVAVMWDDVIRCAILDARATAADGDVRIARDKVLDLLRTRRAKRCLIHLREGTTDPTAWLVEARAAGLRALALVVPSTAKVTIDARASIARSAAGEVVARHFDRVEHARLWLVTATSARHSSKPTARVSPSPMRISIPPRASLRPRLSRRPSGSRTVPPRGR